MTHHQLIRKEGKCLITTLFVLWLESLPAYVVQAWCFCDLPYQQRDKSAGHPASFTWTYGDHCESVHQAWWSNFEPGKETKQKVRG